MLHYSWLHGCMGAWNGPDSKDVSEASGSYHDRHLFPNGPLISETPTGSNQPHGFTLPEQYQLVPLLPFLRAPVPRISVMAPNSPPYSRQCPRSLEDGPCCILPEGPVETDCLGIWIIQGILSLHRSWQLLTLAGHVGNSSSMDYCIPWD